MVRRTRKQSIEIELQSAFVELLREFGIDGPSTRDVQSLVGLAQSRARSSREASVGLVDSFREALGFVKSLGTSDPALLRRLVRLSFEFWEELGVHVTPRHYYEPVPDVGALRRSDWPKPSELVGVRMNREIQVALLSAFAASYKDEYELFPREPTGLAHEYFVGNPMLGSVDGEVLYCMIRHFKPRRIYEIGSGFSTRLAAQAAQQNRREDPRYECDLVAIDPNMSDVLREGFPGLSRAVAAEVQAIPLSEFEALEANDVVFI